jgi:hypothetical protein
MMVLTQEFEGSLKYVYNTKAIIDRISALGDEYGLTSLAARYAMQPSVTDRSNRW